MRVVRVQRDSIAVIIHHSDDCYVAERTPPFSNEPQWELHLTYNQAMQLMGHLRTILNQKRPRKKTLTKKS